MPMNIRQAFLRHPEQTQLMLPRQSWQIGGKFDARSDLAAFGKSLDLPSQGGRKSGFIEQRRIKEIGHSKNVLRDLINPAPSPSCRNTVDRPEAQVFLLPL